MRAPAWIALLLGSAWLAGCGGSAHSASTATTRSTITTATSSTAHNYPSAHPGISSHKLRLTSSAFRPQGRIPARFTCDGADVSLPLSWSGVPAGTKELLLEMRDPDAPTANFVHWSVADISPSSHGVAAGAVPPNGVLGRNSFGTIGYRGPCPPHGKPAHYYVITLSALAGRAGVKTGFAPDQGVRSFELAVATLAGTYGR